MAPSERPRRTWPQRLLIAVNLCLVMATLVVAGTLGYLNYRLDQISRVDLGSTQAQTVAPGEAQNFLLVGVDSAEGLGEDDPINVGREDIGTNSDTIMVLRLDPEAEGARLLSLPRDLFVTIPDVGEARINAALAAGGPDTLVETISDNFGIPIHHYVEVDFLGFKELVSAIDGVPIYFEHPVRDRRSGLFVNAPACVTLDPEQALAYARARNLETFRDGVWSVDGSADLGRIERQQDFIRRAMQRAVVKGVRNPITLNQLVDVGVNNVTLDQDLAAGDLIALGTSFRSFDPDALQTEALDVADDVVNGAEVLRVLDTEANERLLGAFRGVEGDAAGVAGTIRVLSRNGTGAAGQAGVVATGLGELGFDTSPGTGDAEAFGLARTTVQHRPGEEDAAAFVASHLLGGADLVVVDDTGDTDVIVTTGANFEGVADTLSDAPDSLRSAPPPAGGDAPAGPPSTPRGEVPPAEAPERLDCE